jgi:hypothetical protein
MPVEHIESKIYLIRGQKVMLDRDLADLYHVKTKAINQAVRRNKRRFPEDFVFALTSHEMHELVTNCDRFQALKHSTVTSFAFTEQGIAMLSSVLKSERAILVNIAIMRAFVKLRKIISANKALFQKIKELERKFGDRLDKHDVAIVEIFEAIKKLMAPKEKPNKSIGFIVD